MRRSMAIGLLLAVGGLSIAVAAGQQEERIVEVEQLDDNLLL